MVGVYRDDFVKHPKAERKSPGDVESSRSFAFLSHRGKEEPGKGEESDVAELAIDLHTDWVTRISYKYLFLIS